jgi:hypothetical protein
MQVCELYFSVTIAPQPSGDLPFYNGMPSLPDFCHNSHGSPEAAILGFALESGNLDSLGFEVMYFYMIDVRKKCA